MNSRPANQRHIPFDLSVKRTVDDDNLALPVVMSSTEAKVLALLADGMQSKEIAELIGRKKPTVEGYIRALFLKLGAKSRPHLVSLAHRRGLL